MKERKRERECLLTYLDGLLDIHAAQDDSIKSGQRDPLRLWEIIMLCQIIV